MTVLLDLNVVLDALLGREPWRAEADAIWDANKDGQVDARMSAAALPTLFYLALQAGRPGRVPTPAATNCLRSLGIVPVDRTTPGKWRRPCPVPTSRTRESVVFQDRLLAVQARLDAIVTRDPKGFAGSPVPVLTPAELLALLPKAPDA